MHPESINGFTLFELLVTVAVASILLGLGMPSFTNAIKDGRIASASTCLTGALYTARSEAVKRSLAVTVCPYNTGDTCGTDWTNGALVFSEGSSTAATTDLGTAAVDSDSVIIRTCPALHNTLDVSASASADRSVASVAERNFIRFARDGSPNWQIGYISVCDDRSAEQWKGIRVGISGDVRPTRLNADGDALLDGFNRDITSC